MHYASRIKGVLKYMEVTTHHAEWRKYASIISATIGSDNDLSPVRYQVIF